jgi:hypothetical protein
MRSLYVLPCAVRLRHTASNAKDHGSLDQDEEVEEEKKSKKKATTKKRSAKKQPDSDEEGEEEEEVSSPFFGWPCRVQHRHSFSASLPCSRPSPRRRRRLPPRSALRRRTRNRTRRRRRYVGSHLIQSISQSTRLTQLAVFSRRRSRRRGADASRPLRSRKSKRSRTKSRFEEWSLRALPPSPALIRRLARSCRVLTLDTQLCEAF